MTGFPGNHGFPENPGMPLDNEIFMRIQWNLWSAAESCRIHWQIVRISVNIATASGIHRGRWQPAGTCGNLWSPAGNAGDVYGPMETSRPNWEPYEPAQTPEPAQGPLVRPSLPHPAQYGFALRWRERMLLQGNLGCERRESISISRFRRRRMRSVP